MVVAITALFVALGGTGYAALELPRHSVGTKQLKRNAVTTAKIENGTLRLKDFYRRDLSRLKRAPAWGQRSRRVRRLRGFRRLVSRLTMRATSGSDAEPGAALLTGGGRRAAGFGPTGRASSAYRVGQREHERDSGCLPVA